MPMDNSTVWGTWTRRRLKPIPYNPLVASRNGLDGRTTRGSIDDYWVQYDSTANDPYITGGWTQHAWGDAFGDYMKTSQSAYGNTDGATYFNWYTNGTPLTCADMVSRVLRNKDGTYGRKLFYEARGYSVTECYNQRTDNNCRRILLFQTTRRRSMQGIPFFSILAGHSIVGVGYQDPSTVYLNDTWDHADPPDDMGRFLFRHGAAVRQRRESGAPQPLPTITALDPSSATPGGPAFTLTVNGTGFIDSSVVRWNGADRPTTW